MRGRRQISVVATGSIGIWPSSATAHIRTAKFIAASVAVITPGQIDPPWADVNGGWPKISTNLLTNSGENVGYKRQLCWRTIGPGGGTPASVMVEPRMIDTGPPIPVTVQAGQTAKVMLAIAAGTRRCLSGVENASNRSLVDLPSRPESGR